METSQISKKNSKGIKSDMKKRNNNLSNFRIFKSHENANTNIDEPQIQLLVYKYVNKIIDEKFKKCVPIPPKTSLTYKSSSPPSSVSTSDFHNQFANDTTLNKIQKLESELEQLKCSNKSLISKLSMLDKEFSIFKSSMSKNIKRIDLMNSQMNSMAKPSISKITNINKLTPRRKHIKSGKSLLPTQRVKSTDRLSIKRQKSAESLISLAMNKLKTVNKSKEKKNRRQSNRRQSYSKKERVLLKNTPKVIGYKIDLSHTDIEDHELKPINSINERTISCSRVRSTIQLKKPDDEANDQEEGAHQIVLPPLFPSASSRSNECNFNRTKEKYSRMKEVYKNFNRDIEIDSPKISDISDGCAIKDDFFTKTNEIK